MEPAGFNVDYETKRDQWRESLDAITRMFVEEPFAGYDGRWLRMPVRNVVPKPRQKPHPPLWMAAPRPDVIPLAARNGLGALCFSMLIEPAVFLRRTMSDVREAGGRFCVREFRDRSEVLALEEPVVLNSPDRRCGDDGADRPRARAHLKRDASMSGIRQSAADDDEAALGLPEREVVRLQHHGQRLLRSEPFDKFSTTGCNDM